MDIAQIDKNFKIAEIDENGFEYYDVTQAPFSLEGLPWFQHNGNSFRRLPDELKVPEINQGAFDLKNHTAGVCVRFQTDSKELQIKAVLAYGCDMNHMTRTGSCGFDSYSALPGEKLFFSKSVQINHYDGESSVKLLLGAARDSRLRSWLVNFPLYGGVKKVLIGIQKGAKLLPPIPHKVKKPIVFYGSSITQGGCASRPGNVYTSLLCRALDAEQINLGFSGSAKGETAMAHAIAELDPEIFVYDYDHNAPDADYLRKTHETFFKIIRTAHPNLPIILASKCDFYGIEQDLLRREVVKTTYENALKAGDENIYFVDGVLQWGAEDRDACTVDGCHPNDLGFYRMYQAFLPVLKKIIG